VFIQRTHTTQKESAKLTQKRNLRRLHHRERAIIKELPQLLAAAGIRAAAKSHFSFSNSHIKKNVVILDVKICGRRSAAKSANHFIKTRRYESPPRPPPRSAHRARIATLTHIRVC
jgi:hypothetical protein